MKELNCTNIPENMPYNCMHMIPILSSSPGLSHKCKRRGGQISLFAESKAPKESLSEENFTK